MPAIYHEDVMRRFQTRRGFTLVELLITVAILAIVLTIGVPSFRDFIQNNRLRGITNNLVLDINFARSEAVKRGTQVILCRSAAPAANPPSCGGTAETWTTGWIVFASQDSDTSYTNGTDILIKHTPAATTGITIIANSEADAYLAFNSDGMKYSTNAANPSAKFAICDDRDGDTNYDEEYGRELTVINTGRPSLQTGTTTTPIASCDNP
ncbi:MAG: type IVa pilus pseudopilin TppE [Gammaproteobacteria bacterium]|nr:MAG: type IVa pilus pseudopilin TppE [Gammaproteobacteria bacterium]